MVMGSDVLVVGGGIQGSSAAFHLARMGVSVRVLEKDYVARHASGVNAGGVRTLGRHQAELPLSLAAKAMWLEIADLLGDNCGFRAVGGIRIAETESDLQKVRERSGAISALALGYVERVIDSQELFERLPALARHCVGGLFVHDDGYANPYRTTLAFRRAAGRAGAKFEEGTVVESALFKENGWTVTARDGTSYRAQTLLNCAGAWGHRVAAMLGDDLPLSPNGSMMIITARMPPMVVPVVGAAGRSLSFKQFPNGTVLLGGGHRAPVDLDTNEAKVDPLALGKAASTVIDLFPFMAEAQAVRFWSGIEGFMPDGIPVIGASLNAPQAYHAFGFSAHGFQLGPAVGQVLADLVTKGTSRIPIEAFSPSRPFFSIAA